MPEGLKIVGMAVVLCVHAGCGGGGSGAAGPGDPGPGDPVPTITSFELVDPTPGEEDTFGNDVVILANGNIVVTDPLDSSVALGAGAVHLYDALTRSLVASIYGNTVQEELEMVYALPNGNFVVVSGG
jgi:sugar lactone lactonase YvrE